MERRWTFGTLIVKYSTWSGFLACCEKFQVHNGLDRSALSELPQSVEPGILMTADQQQLFHFWQNQLANFIDGLCFVSITCNSDLTLVWYTRNLVCVCVWIDNFKASCIDGYYKRSASHNFMTQAAAYWKKELKIKPRVTICRKTPYLFSGESAIIEKGLYFCTTHE